MGDHARRELAWPDPASLGQALDEHFDTRPHAAAMGAALADLERGPARRTLILAAPQSTAHTSVTEWAALYWLARRPWQRVLLATYSRPASRMRGRRIRSMVKTYGRHLGLRVAARTPGPGSWELHTGGGLTCCAPREAVAGMYDLLLIDDPHRCLPETVDGRRRVQVVDWCRWLMGRRINPDAPVAVVMRRWHTADLAGVLLGEEGAHPAGAWRVLNTEAAPHLRPRPPGGGSVFGHA